MIYYLLGAYLFLSFSSGIAMIQRNTWTEWTASIIAGFFWPFIFTSRLIRTLNHYLK